jgi:hypothetical protein
MALPAVDMLLQAPEKGATPTRAHEGLSLKALALRATTKALQMIRFLQEAAVPEEMMLPFLEWKIRLVCLSKAHLKISSRRE